MATCIADIERAGDDFAITLRQHETSIFGEPAMDLVEKLFREILATVIVPVDMTFIQVNMVRRWF